MGLKEEIAAAQQKGRVHSPVRRHAEGCFAVEVADNANVPELRPGDIVIVDPRAELVAGDFVWIEIRYRKTRQRTFRQYWEYRGGKVRLVPLNKNYRTYQPSAPGEPDISILGKVVELSRSFFAPAAGGAEAMLA